RRPTAAKLDAVAARPRDPPWTHADVANDDIVSAIVVTRNHAFHRDARARRGLTGNGDIWLGDTNVAADDPPDIEDNNSPAIRRSCFGQAPRAGRVEISNLDDAAPASAFRNCTPTFSAWEGFHALTSCGIVCRQDVGSKQ